jgi:sRNA-binding regulator protein Hfq
MGEKGDGTVENTGSVQMTDELPEQRKQDKNDGPNLLGKLRGKVVRVWMGYGEFHEGVIERYSRYEILLSLDDGTPMLIMKHAIAFITPCNENPFKVVKKEEADVAEPQTQA